MTITTQKNITRAKTVKEMIEIFKNHYGAENVYIIGDSEIAVKVDEAENKEPIYATFSPTVKDYADRKTPKKTILKFNAPALADDWKNTLKQREIKAVEAAEKKRKKIEFDKKMREKRKAEREKGN